MSSNCMESGCMFRHEDLKVALTLRSYLKRAIAEGYAEVISWHPDHPGDLLWAQIKMYSNQEIEQSINQVSDK